MKKTTRAHISWLCFCRLARPSEYVPLSAADFMDDFQSLWDEHVQFGTSRSHKKLLGKKRTQDAAGVSGLAGSSAMESAPRTQHGKSSSQDAGGSGADGSEGGDVKKLRRDSARTMTAAASSTQGGASAPSDAAPMASKGRFSGTLAARLLGGGGG